MPVLTAGIEHQVSPVTFMVDVRQLGWQRKLSPQPEQGVAHIPHPATAHRFLGLYAQTAEISGQSIKAVFVAGWRCANVRFRSDFTMSLNSRGFRLQKPIA